ncbi:granulocyte colony-stimulating factor isoform X2, partial [Clarias magur]
MASTADLKAHSKLKLPEATMYFYLGAFLALSAVGRFVLPAPLPETRPTLDIKDMEAVRNPEFQDAAESASSLMAKILAEIPAVHKSLIHTTTLSLNERDLGALQYLKETLDLPEPSPLQPPTDKFNLESSLSHMVEGVKLHKTLLKVIAELPHFRFKKPGELLYDLRDALPHLHK